MARTRAPFFGNASTDHLGRGWVVGDFVPDAFDVRATDGVEIKWSVHPTGDKRVAWTDEEPRTTASFMISGRFTIHLPDEVFVLDKQGDYLVFGAGTSHWWEALEDSVMLTVRW